MFLTIYTAIARTCSAGTELRPASQLLAPIGIFDSGYGGLTVFRAIRERLPGYDYLYLGDNARAPYGNRSFETIHEYTWECVQWLFSQGCPLVILACNTASAKALRTIQQEDLPHSFPDRRVLGVIRPTAEVIGTYSQGGKIGIVATSGTVGSRSYPMEIRKFFPELGVTQQACPLWVPLIENGSHLDPAAEHFIRQPLTELLSATPDMDTLLLACTHYPLIEAQIRSALPARVRIVAQGDIVADSLQDYLQRHPEMDGRLSRGGHAGIFTTDDAADFDRKAGLFFGEPLQAKTVHL